MGKIGLIAWFCALVGGAACAGEAPEFALPDGQMTRLQEWLVEEDSGTNRFRFVYPELSALAADFDAQSAALLHLCETVALPSLPDQTGQVVISLSEAETEFGVMDPDVMQVFEAYRIENGVCIWEMF